MPFMGSTVSPIDSLKEILRMCIIFNSMMSIDSKHVSRMIVSGFCQLRFVEEGSQLISIAVHRAVCHKHPRLNNNILLSTHPTSVAFYRGGFN